MGRRVLCIFTLDIMSLAPRMPEKKAAVDAGKEAAGGEVGGLEAFYAHANVHGDDECSVCAATGCFARAAAGCFVITDQSALGFVHVLCLSASQADSQAAAGGAASEDAVSMKEMLIRAAQSTKRSAAHRCVSRSVAC